MGPNGMGGRPSQPTIAGGPGEDARVAPGGGVVQAWERRDFCRSPRAPWQYGRGMATIQIDNLGLQPPEPMVRILAALGGLGIGDEVVALMDREPLLLYPELERRGFSWEFEEGGDHFVLTIRRAAS